MKKVLCCAAALALAAGTLHAQSTLQSPVGGVMRYRADTGWLANAAADSAVVAAFPVTVADSNFIRVYLADVELAEGSQVRFTSMRDGETQILDAKLLEMWGYTSAYFNGDTLLVEVIAAPNTVGNRIAIKDVGYELGVQPAGDGAQCGIVGSDSRSPSSESWSGRIMPVGCSGTVYCSGGAGMVTAGHCLDGQSNLVVHFNVPPSTTGCGTVAPPVADQFPVQPGFRFSNNGVGSDWGVLRMGTNNLGQTPFSRYGTFRALGGSAADNTVTGIFGYGLDTTCVRSQTQQFSPGSITDVNNTNYDISNDVRGGNSGSGYIRNSDGAVVGVVTHCRQDGPNVAQRIDLAAFVNARNLLNPCSGGVTPSNNGCGLATVVDLGNYSGTTLGATPDGVASCGSSTSSPDVWYSFRPGCDGEYVFNTCGSSYDTVISLHTSCGGASLFCDDDSGDENGCVGNRDSFLRVPLTGGTTYLLRVSGFSGLAGNFNLNIEGGPAPSHDGCFNPIGAVAGDIYAGSTLCASNDGSAGCGASTSSPDVWYSYTPTCSGVAVIDTAGSTYDTVLSVHNGCPGTTNNQVVCNDDAIGLQSRVSFDAAAGVTYRIRVSGFAGRSGFYQMFINDCTPDNNACHSRFAVSDGLTNFTTVNATTDGPAEPTNCFFASDAQISQDVWYVYTASCTGSANLTTCGLATWDTELAVYAGSQCPTFASAIACNDDACGFRSNLDFPTIAGQNYVIRVGGYRTSVGNGSFSLVCTPGAGCAWQTPGGCAGDFDGDSDFDSDDITGFFGALDSGDGCADADEDGDSDSDDVVEFFNRWDAGSC